MNQAVTEDIAGLIQSLSPVNALKSDLLQALVRSAVTETIEQSTLIEQKDTHHVYTYLIKGQASLLNGDLRSDLLAESKQAKAPLFEGGATSANIGSDSVILKLDSKQFQALHNKQVTDALVIHEAEVSQDTYTTFSRINEQFESGTRPLFSSPDIAVRMHKALMEPGADVHAILFADPLLLARALDQMVARIGDGAVPPSVDLRTAMQGRDANFEAPNLARVALDSVLKTDNAWVREQYQAYYDQASRVAALSYALAKALHHENPDQVRLAGLLHNIGNAVLLKFVDSEMAQHSPEQLQKMVDSLTPFVGAQLVDAWNFGAWMNELPLICNHWYHVPSNPKKLTANEIVIIACHINAEKLGKPGLPSLAGTALGRAIKALGLNPADMSTILVQAAQLLRSARGQRN